jgi:hypothetical protein
MSRLVFNSSVANKEVVLLLVVRAPLHFAGLQRQVGWVRSSLNLVLFVHAQYPVGIPRERERDSGMNPNTIGA